MIRSGMGDVATTVRWVDRLSPAAAFLWVAGAFGLAMAFVTPPLQSPDEPQHWFRADRVVQLHWLDVRRSTGADDGDGTVGGVSGPYTYGGPVPADVVDCCDPFARLSGWVSARVGVGQILAEFRRPLRPQLTRRRPFQSLTLYSPVPYAPAAVGMAPFRWLRAPPIVLMYAGRLGSLAAYLAVGWAAVRTTPVLRWPLAAVMTQPMNLFLAASISADPMTTALAYLLTALVLRGCLGPADPTRRAEAPAFAAAVAAVAIGLALCKTAYLPVVAMVLAVPARRWPGGRRWSAWAIVLAAAGVSAAWSAVTHPLHVRLIGDDPATRWAWVKSHPAAFAAVCGRTVWEQAGQLAYTSTGELGWLDTPMPPAVVVIDLVALAVLTVGFDGGDGDGGGDGGGEPRRLGWRPRVLAAAALGASSVLILLSQFLVWTRAGADQIAGLQGRYFLPLAGLVGVVVYRGGRGRPVRPRWVVTFMATVAAYTLVTLVRRYYLPEYAITVG